MVFELDHLDCVICKRTITELTVGWKTFDVVESASFT